MSTSVRIVHNVSVFVSYVSGCFSRDSSVGIISLVPAIACLWSCFRWTGLLLAMQIVYTLTRLPQEGVDPSAAWKEILRLSSMQCDFIRSHNVLQTDLCQRTAQGCFCVLTCPCLHDLILCCIVCITCSSFFGVHPTIFAWATGAWISGPSVANYFQGGSDQTTCHIQPSPCALPSATLPMPMTLCLYHAETTSLCMCVWVCLCV